MTRALPSALTQWTELAARLEPTRIALFLDYDGTLTRIAPRPEEARLDPRVRQLLAELARLVPIAIVSGRGLVDVQTLVDLPELYYAGSHGFDIAGPQGLRFVPDEHLPHLFAQVTEALRPAIEHVPGVVLESKGFSIAVHYRLSPPERVSELETAVDRVVTSHEGLLKTFGKKVFEIRPTLDWHKGTAVTWLLEHLGDDRLPVFIGDDRTDEDALAVVAEHGIGIFVGNPQWETAATYGLADPAEVAQWLEKLSQTRPR